MGRERPTPPAAGSQIRAFFAWWREELEDLFGRPTHRRRSLKPSTLLFYRDGQLRVFDVRCGVPDEIAAFLLDHPRGGAPDLPASGALHLSEELRARLRRRSDILLRLAPDHGVIARDVVPRASERELREIVGHRLDVLTPWSADQAVFDCSVSARLPDGRCEVAVAAVPRSLVRFVVERCEKLGLRVGAIDLADLDQPVPGRFVLWSESARRGPLPLVTAVALAGVGGLLLAFAWAASEIHARSVVLSEGERTTAALAARLADVPELRRQLEDLRAELGLLAGQLKAAPSALRIIEELARILPDDVFLQRLELARERLVISGYAPSASVLVPLLEASQLLEQVRFEAPSIKAQLDGAFGRRELERFVLSARLERTERGGS